MKHVIMIFRTVLMGLVMLTAGCDDTNTDLNTPSPGNLGGSEDVSTPDALVPALDASLSTDALAPDSAVAVDADVIPTEDGSLTDVGTEIVDATIGSEDALIGRDADVTLENLTTGIFSIRQSWAQETDYERQVHVQVPSGSGPLPTLILLHGNGGNGAAMLGIGRDLPGRILVAPDGYRNSWNCGSEASTAPDVDFIRSIIERLKQFENVDASAISVLGVSNGSALTNRLLIELEDDTFQHAVTIVSPLNTNQYRDGNFFAYPYEQSTPVTPVTGRRIMNVAGTEDGLIPYDGGRGVADYTFVASEESIFVWAQHMGYTGPRLMAGTPDEENMNLIGFSYLSGDVIHYKLIGGRHNAGGDRDVRRLINHFLP